MKLPVFAPDRRLADLLMHILVVEQDGGESRLPTRVCPALMLSIRGGAIVEADKSLSRTPRFMVGGASMTPRHTVADSGSLGIVVMFRPGGLQQALGVAAPDVTGSVVPLQAIVGEEDVDHFLRQVDQPRSIGEYVELLQHFLLSLHSPKRKGGIASALTEEHRKLFSPVAQLAARFGIGERQFERKVMQSFGLPLRDLRRIARFGLTLPRLIGADVGWGNLTRIAHEAGYYDQAHMHRDFSELSGLPPLPLVQKIASDDPAYWLYQIPQPDFNRLFIPAY